MAERWAKIGIYDRLREQRKGRERFILHDGPPYANGDIHMGHAMNKVLKDIIVRSQSLLGKDAPYVPGWDCHGLPIEWKIEEERSEEHTSELQSLMRISYAVFCLKKKKKQNTSDRL